MKNNIFVLICLVCLPFFSLNAQIVNVCLEEDSVTLAVENYQYGNIQWQLSTDNENWENIEGAIFHTYTCFPENSTYYRAWITYQNCPPDSSQITFVQRKIQANAGPSKVLNTGFTTELFGNEPNGTLGHWSILSGNGGQLSAYDSSYSLFYGTDSLYSLSWTLTGACGTTHDTITIEYVSNVYNDNVVFVDTTDLIVSDSAEMANGVYRIVFSDSVSISYATILLGLQDDGFLRKVQSCIYMGDTCCMNTVQATLSELLITGAIHIEDFASMIYGQDKSIPNVVKLDHCPTRAEILSDSLFNPDKVYYYMETVMDFDESQLVGNKNAILSFPSLGSPITIASGVQITGFNMSCHPHLGFEMASRWNEPVSLSFGSYNGDFETNLKIRFPENSVTFNAKEKIIWKKKIRLRVMVGGFPIFTSLNFKLSTFLDGFANYTEPFEIEINQHTDYDARIFVDNGVPGKIFDVNGSLTADMVDYDDELRTGEAGIEVSLIGEIAVTFYGSISAYFDIGPKAGWSLCVGNDGNGHWGNQQGFYVQGYAKVGLRPAALLQFLGDWDLYYDFDFLKWDMRRPNRIEYISGNNQQFEGNNMPVAQPIRIKSYDYFNNPSPNNYIYFEPENGGTVNSSDNHFVTDDDGIAEAIWYPATPESKLKVGAFDCNGKYINGGPIIITTAGDICTNSTLTTHAYLDGGLVNLQVSGGVPPYQYSTDGITYENQYTPFSPELGTEYTIHVKDAQNCEAQTIYIRPVPNNRIICLNNNESQPLTDCFIMDDYDNNNGTIHFVFRWLVFQTPLGNICFNITHLPLHNLQPGSYTCVPLSEYNTAGFYTFFAQYSYITAFAPSLRLSITAGSLSYSVESGEDVFSFTIVDELGNIYYGAYQGTLSYHSEITN